MPIVKVTELKDVQSHAFHQVINSSSNPSQNDFYYKQCCWHNNTADIVIFITFSREYS